jgi:hypothetical protein
MVFIDSILIIAGGTVRIGESTTRLNGDVYLIDIRNYEVNRLNYKENSYPQPRRLHAACLVGSTMVMYGGLDENNRALSDVWLFSTKGRAWTPPTVRLHGITDDFSSGLAGHGMVTVPKESGSTCRTLSYIFGGYSPEYGESDHFYSLEVYELIVSVVRIEGKGTPPAKRFNHSMNYLSRFPSIVIYGGKTMENLHFGDMHVFDLNNITWIRVEIVQEEFWSPVAGHAVSSCNLIRLLATPIVL